MLDKHTELEYSPVQRIRAIGQDIRKLDWMSCAEVELTSEELDEWEDRYSDALADAEEIFKEILDDLSYADHLSPYVLCWREIYALADEVQYARRHPQRGGRRPKGKSSSKELVIDGTRYSNVKIACDVLGVSPQAVWNWRDKIARERGCEVKDVVEFDTPESFGSNALPVEVSGVHYPTKQAAAKALDITPKALNQLIREGKALLLK